MSWRRGSTGARREDSQHSADHEQAEIVPADSWEYLVEDGDLDSGRLEARCNDLGADGWELVAVVPHTRPTLSGGGRTTAVQLFFKRRVA